MAKCRQCTLDREEEYFNKRPDTRKVKAICKNCESINSQVNYRLRAGKVEEAREYNDYYIKCAQLQGTDLEQAKIPSYVKQELFGIGVKPKVTDNDFMALLSGVSAPVKAAPLVNKAPEVSPLPVDNLDLSDLRCPDNAYLQTLWGMLTRIEYQDAEDYCENNYTEIEEEVYNNDDQRFISQLAALTRKHPNLKVVYDLLGGI